MSKKKPPPKADEYSAFKNLLGKIAKVPKTEVDKKAEEYREERERKKA